MRRFLHWLNWNTLRLGWRNSWTWVGPTSMKKMWVNKRTGEEKLKVLQM